MAISLSDNIQNNSNKPIDNKYGPYASLALAKSGVVSTYRYQGLTVGVIESGSVVEYMWKDGILDTDLVLKTAASPPIVADDYPVFDPATEDYSIDMSVKNLDEATGRYKYYIYQDEVAYDHNNFLDPPYSGDPLLVLAEHFTEISNAEISVSDVGKIKVFPHADVAGVSYAKDMVYTINGRIVRFTADHTFSAALTLSAAEALIGTVFEEIPYDLATKTYVDSKFTDVIAYVKNRAELIAISTVDTSGGYARITVPSGKVIQLTALIALNAGDVIELPYDVQLRGTAAFAGFIANAPHGGKLIVPKQLVYGAYTFGNISLLDLNFYNVDYTTYNPDLTYISYDCSWGSILIEKCFMFNAGTGIDIHIGSASTYAGYVLIKEFEFDNIKSPLKVSGETEYVNIDGFRVKNLRSDTTAISIGNPFSTIYGKLNIQKLDVNFTASTQRLFDINATALPTLTAQNILLYNSVVLLNTVANLYNNNPAGFDDKFYISSVYGVSTQVVVNDKQRASLKIALQKTGSATVVLTPPVYIDAEIELQSVEEVGVSLTAIYPVGSSTDVLSDPTIVAGWYNLEVDFGVNVEGGIALIYNYV